MTKCTVFGENTETNIKKKPIEFVKVVRSTMKISDDIVDEPDEYDNILLIGPYGPYDCMYAYNEGAENDGIIYFGHWNDGVV